MKRLINILILLAGIVFISGIAVGYGFVISPFPSRTFYSFAMACLTFAISLTLLQIRDKK